VSIGENVRKLHITSFRLAYAWYTLLFDPARTVPKFPAPQQTATERHLPAHRQTAVPFA